MDLTSCGEINTREGAVNREFQGRNVYLRQVDVRRPGAMDTCDRSPINDWKSQVMANQVVSWRGRRRRSGSIVWIKSNVNEERWANENEQF